MSSILHPKIVVSVTSIIVLLILFSLAQEMNRRWQVEKEVHQLELDANDLQKNVIELENLNQYFRTPDYQERLAREKLNYRAPGEKVVLIPENEQGADTAPLLPKKEVTETTSIPLKWWEIFFVDKVQS